MSDIVQTSGISSLDLNYYTDKIKDSVDRISKEFYYIGYYLWEINHFKAYKNNGFDTIYDYAASELKFNKSSVYNFIGIINKFADFEGGYPRFGSTKKFEEFNYSQMCEMLSLSDDNIKKIKPDMTIKEIRSIKKELKVVAPVEVAPVEVAPVEVASVDYCNCGYVASNILSILISKYSALRLETKDYMKAHEYLDYCNTLQKIKLDLVNLKL